ncbi:hypothetical protein HDU76_005352 [Blyttiomyces sp. JEL0837]|nr:hypothetical protein HDU76_005352 [Blyttiomyces sp. JEL0837]
MKSNLIAALTAVTAFIGTVTANPRFFMDRMADAKEQRRLARIESAKVDGLGFIIPNVTEGFYTQSVDHFGNAKGVNGSSTFQQWYAMVDQFYKPGGPVIFYLEGEGPAYATDLAYGLTPQVAQTYNALIVTLEHRFYGANGRSVPTEDFSKESLKLLTSEQNIADIVQFVKEFPTLFPQYNITKNTKWILQGGSYAGAIAAFTRSKHPDLFYAAHASSAPVKAKVDFWEYSYAVDSGVSQTLHSNVCASGFTRAIGILDHKIDTIIAYQKTRPNDAQKLKDSFWFGQVRNWGDFTGYVSTVFAGSVQYGDQYSKFDNNGNTWIQAVCDGVMFPAFTNPNATDDELFTALQNMTIQSLIGLYGITGNDDPNMDSFNSDSFGNDTSINATYKLWTTQYCNEFGYLQDAVPRGKRLESHSMYSKYVNVDYQVWACTKYLNDDTVYPQVEKTNWYYGGLNIRTSNIFWVNGDIDPWHWLSNYQSAPGLNQDALLIHDGHHCSDLYGRDVGDSEYTKGVYDQIFKVYDKWLL